jgi:putative endonuclease
MDHDATPPPTQPTDRLTVGARGERIAADHLTAAGLEIVARNWRVAAGPVRGELDLIALDHAAAQVVVCEVKTRTGPGFGGPLQAVTQRKQARIRRLAVAFLVEAGLPYRQVRFDVVGIRLDQRPPAVQHVVGAF